MKTWLKGGLISVGVYLIFSIIIFISIFLCSDGFGGKCGYRLLLFGVPSAFLINSIFTSSISEVPNSVLIFTSWILNLILMFLIGALIGFIIQKIKERKKRESIRWNLYMGIILNLLNQTQKIRITDLINELGF